MLIKTVFPVEELAGTIGMGASPSEATFYKRSGLQCARQYVFPANPNTVNQQTQRTNLYNAAQYYSATLTDQQRLDWAAYAAAHPKIIKGQSVNIGALAMFCSYAIIALGMGQAIAADPPSGATPAPDPNTYAFSVAHFYASGSPGFTTTIIGTPAFTAGQYITGEYTAALPGAQMPRDTDYRYIRDVSTNQFAKLTTTTSASQTFSNGEAIGTTGERRGYRVRLWRAGNPTPTHEWTGVLVVEAAP